MCDLARKSIIVSAQQLGTECARARKRKGWTQQELAYRIGVMQKTISHLETGNPAIKLETLLKILNAFEMDLLIADCPDQEKTPLGSIF